MGLVALHEEVEARLSEEMFGSVLKALSLKHTYKSNKDWKSCSCEYCTLKTRYARDITIARIPDELVPKYYAERRIHVSNGWTKRDDRDMIREYYRKQMRALRCEAVS